MKTLLKLSLMFTLAPSLGAQTWYTLVPASQQSLSMIVTLPVGATYRIGDSASNRWTAPIVVTATTTKVVDYADGAPGHPPDPAPGVSKEFDVLETSAVLNVTVGTLAKTVPAAPPAPMVTYIVTCTGTMTFPSGTPPATLNISSATCTAVKQ